MDCLRAIIRPNIRVTIDIRVSGRHRDNIRVDVEIEHDQR